MKITAIYDNWDTENESFDRYTVLTDDTTSAAELGCVAALGLSYDPDSPQGYSQYGYAKPGDHLGRRIRFEDLSEEVQRHIARRLLV